MSNNHAICFLFTTLPLRVFAPAAIALVLGVCPQLAPAGSINILTGPTVALTGIDDLTDGGAQNAFELLQPATDQVKIFTTEDLVLELIGNTGTIEVGVTGTVSAVIGDMASGDYDMNFSLTGTGSFDILISGEVNIGLPIGFDFSETGITGPLGPPPVNFQGGATTDPSPLGVSNVPLTASLTINWTGQAGDQMTIDIPPNSIDFGVAVPEPSLLLTLPLAVGCLLVRRRAHAR